MKTQIDEKDIGWIMTGINIIKNIHTTQNNLQIHYNSYQNSNNSKKFFKEIEQIALKFVWNDKNFK